MKTRHILISKCKDQRGVTAIVVAIALVMLIGFVALAVDIGYIAATKNELQNVSDSAALAATGLLGQIYAGMTYEEQQSYNCSSQDNLPSDSYANDCLSIIARAQNVVGSGKNKAGGKNISIDPGDIFINKWDESEGPFDDNDYDSPDAVRVIALRDGSANGPITTFFAKIFGIDTADVKADATAALTGPSEVGPGKMRLPIGLSLRQFFDPDGKPKSGVCGQLIKLSPTKDSCAGWHNFFSKSGASFISENLFTFIDQHPYDLEEPPGPDEECELEPCGTAWFTKFFPGYDKTPGGTLTDLTKTEVDDYNFSGGSIGDLFTGERINWPVPGDQASWSVSDAWILANGNPSSQGKSPAPFPALFDYLRFRDNESSPYYLDANNNGIDDAGDIKDPDLVWTTTAPIYDEDLTATDCTNPGGPIKIKGFATVHVIMPNPPPDKTVNVIVECDFTVIHARGGGGIVGNIKGDIPNLVE